MTDYQDIVVSPPFIKLDAFLKFSTACDTGGEAKMLIQNGEVKVNGQPCTQRGKKLVDGDIVHVYGENYRVKIGEKIP